MEVAAPRQCAARHSHHGTAMREKPTETTTTNGEREREKVRPTLAATEPSTREAAPKKPYFYSPIIDTD